MSNLSAALNTAKLALAAQQFGLSVAGHNIANVNTDNYSRQTISFTATEPYKFGGHVVGSGVRVNTIERISNEFIEERLLNLKSDLAANDEAASYVRIMENLFTENSENSISTIMSEFWNAWHALSNNPQGSSERVLVYETGVLAAERINDIYNDLSDMETDLSQEILAVLPEVNRLSADIAQLNADIVAGEATDSANDLRDQRNSLVTALSEQIGLYTFEQPNGALVITTAGGYSLVNGVDAFSLESTEGEVKYQDPYGGTVVITDQVTGGAIGGWLEIQKEIIPKYKAELDNLSHELIWAVNYQHSQGVGEEYFSFPVAGTNGTDESGLLSTLSYGDRIDYTKDFKMWVQNGSDLPPTYHNIEIDMGISTAEISNWRGQNPEQASYGYEFTVTDGGTVNADANITITDGPGLGIVQAGVDVTTALDSAIAAQTLTVVNVMGNQSILVDDGGDAERSAASIAAALNSLRGVEAHASENTAFLDITNILPPAVTDAHPADEVSFTLTSGGNAENITFQVGATADTTRMNMLSAIETALVTMNSDVTDLVLDSSRLMTDNIIALTSIRGENIGIENFNVQDLPTATLDNFQNLGVDTAVTVSNFANLSNLETVDFTITTAQGSLTVNFAITDDTNQGTLALDFQNALTAAGLGAIGIASVQVGNTVQLTGNASAGFIDFQAVSTGTGTDESFDIAAGAGTSQYPALGDNTLTFDGTGDREQYAGNNTVTMTINGTDNITVDLRRVDTTDQTAVAQAFFRGLDTHVTDAVVENLGTSVTIRAIAETAADFAFTAGTETNGVDGSFDISVPNALPLAADTFTLDGADTATFTSVVNTDTITFNGTVLTESGGLGDDSAVKTGLVTINLEDGYTIRSNVGGGAGGIFDLVAGVDASVSNAIITFGGDGGYQDFNPGDVIGFRVDEYYTSFLVGPADDTDEELAIRIEGALLAAGLPPTLYSVVRNGASVSLLKSDGSPIEITNFNDDRSGGGSFARLAVSTGESLSSQNPDTASSLIGPGALISWKKYNSNGMFTGTEGTIEVGDAGTYLVEGSLSFDIESGTLVAGNTFTLNTESHGIPDPLQFAATLQANSILDTYKFKVMEDTGGEIGADDIMLEWSNGVKTGKVTLEGSDPSFTPVVVYVDGMKLRFDSGTLYDGDTFTLTTDENGTPAIDLPSEYHWTILSFADQFNRQSYGVEATITDAYQLKFSPTTDGFKTENTVYSGSDGFSEENITITVNDYEMLDKAWTGMSIIRDELTYPDTDGWGILATNNPGYDVSLAPIDGFDMDNGFFINFNGVRTFTVTFEQPVTDNGSVTLDITPADERYLFAFSDADAEDSGLMAALGINTYFKGEDAMTIGVNNLISQARYLGATYINPEDGTISFGDNTNALAIADIQYATTQIATWTYELGKDEHSTVLTTTIENYYQVMVGSLGLKAQSINRSTGYNEIMVNKIGEQRDAISAVSLDEEMINMIQFQHAYTVAAKLFSITDEMLKTIINSY